MYRYSLEERVFVVKTYWITGLIKNCQRRFVEQFGGRNPPLKRCIQLLVKSLKPKEHGGEANNRFATSCTVFSDISGLPPPCSFGFKLFTKVECSISTAGFGLQTVQQTSSGNS
jgi:hypothetical protein